MLNDLKVRSARADFKMNLDKTETIIQTKDLDLNLNLEQQLEIGIDICIDRIGIDSGQEYNVYILNRQYTSTATTIQEN